MCVCVCVFISACICIYIHRCKGDGGGGRGLRNGESEFLETYVSALFSTAKQMNACVQYVMTGAHMCVFVCVCACVCFCVCGLVPEPLV